MNATIVTNQGNIELELFNSLAPKTVKNFTDLAAKNFYDGILFHRVIANFMIQTGDPLTKEMGKKSMWGTGGPGYTFDDEIHIENKNNPYTISMANAGPNTNGSQFFINVATNNFLDDKHTVFGKVISGQDTVDSIAKVETNSQDAPKDSIVIEQVIIN